MMRTKITVNLLAVMLAAILMAALPLRAQSDRSSWNDLRKAKAGQEIEIVLNDATSYKGALSSWNDEGIVARLSTGEMMFARADVMRVARYKPSRRLRQALIGAAVGGVTGAFLVKSCGGWCGGAGDKATLIGGTAGIGAVVGVALPSGKGWEVVYRRQ
jgi:hypothetical protein